MDAATGEITVLVPLDSEEAERAGKLREDAGSRKPRCRKRSRLCAKRRELLAAAARRANLRPTNGRLDFIVPLLCVRENGMLFEFEITFLLEQPWKLSTKDATLSDTYNPLKRPMAKAGSLDIGAKGEVERKCCRKQRSTDFVGHPAPASPALGATGDWTLDTLIAWLDRQIDHQDIPAGESAEFLRKVIRGLMAKFGIADISVLALDRFRLRGEIEDRIQQHRDSERRAAFQQFLLPGSPLAVSGERMINFKTMSYEPSWLYEGGFQFKKHYFGPKPGELKETTPSGELKEEFQCAQFLDGLPEVKFWLRNLSRKSSSFRLQTSKDWFYPDFLCQLNDGRSLVVEYKGEHLFADAEEKRAVGAVWEGRSNGTCLFVMPEGRNLEAIRRKISGK